MYTVYAAVPQPSANAARWPGCSSSTLLMSSVVVGLTAVRGRGCSTGTGKTATGIVCYDLSAARRVAKLTWETGSSILRVTVVVTGAPSTQRHSQSPPHPVGWLRSNLRIYLRTGDAAITAISWGRSWARLVGRIVGDSLALAPLVMGTVGDCLRQILRSSSSYSYSSSTA